MKDYAKFMAILVVFGSLVAVCVGLWIAHLLVVPAVP